MEAANVSFIHCPYSFVKKPSLLSFCGRLDHSPDVLSLHSCDFVRSETNP
ncbi:hypothetical protein [Halobacillus litoralis]|nr:hypothetical protein [Halobacillus litoralis]MCA1022171.1 hypothetical protein [Halobacillus litoralis]